MASMLQGRGRGKMDGQKHEECSIFFLYCPLSHSHSNAYHTGCHERVSSSIGHGCMSSFSEIIHIKPTVELAVELPVQLLVLCVSYTTLSGNEDMALPPPHLYQLSCYIAVRHYTEERTS